MTTWTSKFVPAFLGLLLLVGCTEELGFAAIGPKPSETMTQVALAEGRVNLSAPGGFCVSPRSVKDTKTGSFAMLARCDTLGASDRAMFQSLAILTATTTPQEGSAAPSLEGLSKSVAPAQITAKTTRDSIPMIRVKTQEPVAEGLSPEHWRTALVINDQLVAFALYAPEGSQALKEDGADLLADLSTRTRTASR